MARYTGPAFKKSRQLGFSTLENGKDLAKRPFPPGVHGRDRKRKVSEYGVQLKEKQKLRFMYGLTEKQFHKIFSKAERMQGIAGENLLVLLESRLDNLVYRIGFAKTRRGARQLVNHGHVCVNDKKVDIPSYTVKVGSTISIKENSLNHPAVKEALDSTLNRLSFVTFDDKKMTATYVRHPERTELNADINEQLVVEFYNR